MNKTLLQHSLGLALGAAMTAPAGALDFSAAYFFGDSLSDSGAYVGAPDAGNGQRFTTDPGEVWSEHLAEHFGLSANANNPNNPANTDPDGTNFAQGGAQVANPIGIGTGASPQAAVPVSGQLGFAFPGNGRADPDALYTVWAGANDLFFQFTRLSAGAPQDDVSAQILASAATLADQVQQLSDRGARYILVPNLPDVSDTPASILLAISAVGASNPNLGNALVAATVTLAQPGATLAEQAAVRQAAVAEAAAQLGVPDAILQFAVDQVATATRDMSPGFNQATATYLQGTSANVIPLDMFSYFKEALADPSALGLVNVTGTACATESALPCTSDTLLAPGLDQAFLFADSVHPSSAGHRLIADYAISVIEAPALVAGLARAPMAAGRMHQSSLERQLLSGRNIAGIGSWSLIADLGAGNEEVDATGRSLDYEADTRGLALGAGYRASDEWYAGFALAVSDTDGDFGRDLGGFDLRSYSLSAFADYRSGIWFGRAIGTLTPKLDLDDVTRRVYLGPSVREESGETSGDALALKLSFGADLLNSGGLRAGPMLGINYQEVRIDGYAERGNRSTSMGFLGQNNESFLLEAGLFADYNTSTDLGGLTLHAAVTREQELMDDERDVSAYLKTLPQQRFTLYDIPSQGSAWSLDLAASVAVSQDVSLVLGYRWRSTDDGDQENYGNLGVQVAL